MCKDKPTLKKKLRRWWNWESQLNRKILSLCSDVWTLNLSGGATGKQNSQDFGKMYQYYTLLTEGIEKADRHICTSYVVQLNCLEIFVFSTEINKYKDA